MGLPVAAAERRFVLQPGGKRGFEKRCAFFAKNQTLRAFESLDIAGLSHHDPNLHS